MQMDKIVAIIPASGIGARFNNFKPKQYFSIFDKTILEYTIELLMQNTNINLILVNINIDDDYYDSIANRFIKKDNNPCSIITIRNGGNTRSKTVKNAILFLRNQKLVTYNDWILVHDAVRCTLPVNLLGNFITEVINSDVGGIMALPVLDTLKKVKNNKISTIDRSNIWQAQTPQMFRLHILLKAFENVDFVKFTDESSLVENLNINPLIVKGDLRNFKITYNEDIELVKLLLNNRKK